VNELRKVLIGVFVFLASKGTVGGRRDKELVVGRKSVLIVEMLLEVKLLLPESLLIPSKTLFFGLNLHRLSLDVSESLLGLFHHLERLRLHQEERGIGGREEGTRRKVLRWHLRPKMRNRGLERRDDEMRKGI